MHIIHKTDVLFKVTSISQHFAKCQEKLTEPKTSAVSATSIILQVTRDRHVDTKEAPTAVKRGSHTYDLHSSFFFLWQVYVRPHKP